MKIFNLFNGWKTVLGYLGLNIIDNNIITVIAEAVTDPTPESISKAFTHALLFIGIVHKKIKELN